jgi:glycosyltransferase involved in cell wall biosynthesis
MAGGLEKNFVRIANYLATTGVSVHLVTFDRENAESFYEISPSIEWHKLGESSPHQKISFFARWRLIGRIRSIVKAKEARTDVIAFHHGILFRLILGSFLTGARILCSERNSLTLYKHIRKNKWNLNFFLLNFCSKIIVQFENYKFDYPKHLESKIVSIHNVVDATDEIAKPDIAINGRFRILAVGRLCDQKNYICLINAFAKIASDYKDWDLCILGDGVMQSELDKLVANLNLKNRISIVPPVKNVSEFYKSSHIFCMPSKWEGFPNALAEALAHGLPAIGFSECSGVKDLITQDENGLLAEGMSDSISLSNALKSLMEKPAKRADFGKIAFSKMKEYQPEKVLPKWKELLENN